jgi:HEAT repeat protein
MLETTSAQQSNIAQILARGWQEAKQNKWSLVNYYLQQLPLTKNKLNFPEVEELAILVLLNGDFQEKWEVAKIFSLLDNSIVPSLIKIVNNDKLDEEIRWFACRILGAFPQANSIAAIASLLQTTIEEELTLIACQTLTQIGTPAIKILSDLLLQPQSRLLAVTALSRIHHPEIIPPLLTVVDDLDPQIRAICIETLGTFRDRQIAPILINALQDTAASVRKEAIVALSSQQSELDLVNYLKPLLYDLNLDVCRQAAIALGKMKLESAVIALFEVLNSPHTPVELKLDLVRALSWSELELALEYLKQALCLESELVCQEIIAVLGRISHPQLKNKATAILVNFCHNLIQQEDRSQLKQMLANSLGILGNSEARSSLKALSIDRDLKVQLHATAALNKLK